MYQLPTAVKVSVAACTVLVLAASLTGTWYYHREYGKAQGALQSVTEALVRTEGVLDNMREQRDSSEKRLQIALKEKSDADSKLLSTKQELERIRQGHADSNIPVLPGVAGRLRTETDRVRQNASKRL